MLRAHVRSSSARRTCTGTALLGRSGPACVLIEPKRYSFKYAKKLQHDEMRQPFFIHEKRYGLFSNEANVRKSRRGLPFITPLYTKHMNLWETDTDASSNRFFRSYVFGQRELHLLLGRPHGFEADEAGGRQGDSAYELNTDVRYKGIPQPAITNLHYEPEWNYTLYRSGSYGAQLANPRSPLTEEVLGPELIEVRDIKSVEHCKAWFDRLAYLIKLHYDAVGDVGPFRSRHTQHVHDFFVCFHDALSSFDFRDTYLLEQFKRVRPEALTDLFGIFLEMEANYVNEDYCPRCSLPFATTRYCGEGDAQTPFRKHRGRWAPHPRWGKEWYDVVTRRAEQLWYRAGEDPYFGTGAHTQRQVEALLRVYCTTKQRAKAVDFITALRGSKEFLLGQVALTDAMQAALDHLLDTTPHPHLLTNAFKLESRASLYTGSSNSVPHSPMQMRLDLEWGKYRRQQREEGVVRVPPASWKMDTTAIVPYKMNKDKQVTNWREVKDGLERSFSATGLPKEAYTSHEWRQLTYLQHRIARRAEERAALEQALQADKAAAAAASSATFLIFPDKSWYRVFDTSPKAVQEFGVGMSGTVFTATATTFADAAAVAYTDPVSGTRMVLDTTAERCRPFGGFEHGDVLRVTETGATEAFEVVVVGVNVDGAESEWSLYAMFLDRALHQRRGLLELGQNCLHMMSRFATVQQAERRAEVSILDDQRTVREEFLGQVVGARQGMLYVQWRLLKGGGSSLDRSVAVPLGTPEDVQRRYTFKEMGIEPLQEPPSWQTPFRNDFLDEELQEALRAPFQRERWGSLVQGKYTPKVKRFGYYQHTTQDDFATKEYQDRLLSKQFFHNPQAFEIIPEQRERSVQFAGKWQAQRTHGTPTVDRHELENGWGEAPAISDDEVGVIEQALRDISGRRPGNFLKSPTETQSLQLNEPWWSSLSYGWEQQNAEQLAFRDSTEQHLIDGARLPFEGKVPPFGTSYGMGERIREIAVDYSKGFGLGPHGYSPGHDTSHFNTLGAEERRVATVGYGNALVRLFNEKLGERDVHAWALEQCSSHDVNVRTLLLSVQEWREWGRPPSLVLSRVLQRYLKDELEVFNSELPEHVPRLGLPNDGSTLSPGWAENGGCLWADVDRTQYGLEYAKHRVHSANDEAYIPALLQRIALRGVSHLADKAYVAHLQQDVLNTFHNELATIVGRGIPPSFVAQKTMALHRGSVRSSGNVVPFIKSTELAKLLAKLGMTAEGISVVMRGLSNCPETEPRADGFVLPVSLVFAWGGPGCGSSRGGSQAAATSSVARGGSSTSGFLPSSHSGSTGGRVGGDDKMVVHVLDELAARHDGLAMDIRYAVRENSRNSVLRREFFSTMLPVFHHDHRKVSNLYTDYCEGKYVPNVTVAIEAFIEFLALLCQHPEQLAGAVAYFEEDTTGRHPGQYTQLRLLPPSCGPFQFENTLVESMETVSLFQKYGILAGPVRVLATGFIAANSKSLTYFTNRKSDVVYVTTENDQGLRQALQTSAHFKAISSLPALRFLLGSHSGAGLVATFNRFFYRTMPMLQLYHGLLQHYVAVVPTLRYESEVAHRGLARAVDQEASTTLEQEFRRNAERYWRNLLEGRSVEEMQLVHPDARARSQQQEKRRGEAGRRPEGGTIRASGTMPSNATGSEASPHAGSGDQARSRSPPTRAPHQRRGGGGGQAATDHPGSRSDAMKNLLSYVKNAPKSGGKRKTNTQQPPQST